MTAIEPKVTKKLSFEEWDKQLCIVNIIGRSSENNGKYEILKAPAASKVLVMLINEKNTKIWLQQHHQCPSTPISSSSRP
jgi:hypothetical protein